MLMHRAKPPEKLRCQLRPAVPGAVEAPEEVPAPGEAAALGVAEALGGEEALAARGVRMWMKTKATTTTTVTTAPGVPEAQAAAQPKRR